MIQPHELRIGNLVLYKDKFIVVRTIEMAEPKRINDKFLGAGIRYAPGMTYYGRLTLSGIVPYSEIEPIPITSEILEQRFAFKAGLYTIRGLSGYIILHHFDGKGYAEYFFGDYSICKVEYLHQLQNLFFSLTGEELY